MEVSSTIFTFCTFLPLASRHLGSSNKEELEALRREPKLSECLTIPFLNWEENSQGKRRLPF